MPLALVQALNESFLLIEKLKDSLHQAAELREVASLANEAGARDDSSQSASGVELEIGELYSNTVSIIHWLCLTPALLALILRSLDLLIGTVWEQRILYSFQAFQVGSAVIQRRRPIVPAIMIGVLACMPLFISGTFVRLAGAYICVDTVLSPLVIYLEKNISDRVEVRWVLVGILLDVVFFISAVVLSATDSIIVVLFLAVLIFGLSYLILILVYQNGWWDSYFKLAPGTVPGRYVQHPISRFLESSSRYVVQLFVFRLNRVAVRLLALLQRLDRLKTRTWVNALNGPFVYSELKSTRHIRLLRIQRGRPSEDIVCHFIEVPLADTETYDAVSYVWGNNSRSQSVSINGYSLAITESAYNILKQRQSLWNDRLLWIDQICINQSNDREKSSQVQMMKEIYQNAVQVLAFLGPDADAHLVQSHMAQLYHRYHGLGYSFEYLKHLYYQESKTAEWDALGRFFGNPYFRRVWILQEAVFAREMSIFYGDICMDWKYISRVLDVLGERQVLEAFLSSDRLFASQTRADIMTGVINANTMSMFRGEVGAKKDYTLSEMLEASLGFNSTDPRDKVYALLGMSSKKSRNEIVPNYSKENLPHQVYTEAMRFLLVRQVNPLHCLNLAGIGHDRLVQDLPSWVPDWSLCIRPQPLDNGYSAASSYNAVIGFDPQDSKLLGLYGETIDTVKYMGEIRQINPTWTAKEVNIYMEKWFSDAEALAQERATNPYPIVGLEAQQVLEAFIRTMISNRCSYDSEVPSAKQCLEDYEATKKYYASPYTTIALSDTNTPAGAALREAILETVPLVERHSLKKIATQAGRFMHFAGSLSMRRFCITEKGRMATVPPLTKEGDSVCLLKGAKMPYVMRKKTDADRNVYELVGNCYVHGVMNGEVPIQNRETFVIV